MSREQPVEPAPDPEVLLPHAYLLAKLAMVMPLFEEARDALPAISMVSAKLRHIDLSLGDRMDFAGTYSLDDWKRDFPGAPIEVLVPRPEPSMSMFANKQDYETARSEWAVQRPAGDDLKDKFHSALGRYWDCAYAEGKEGRECDDFEGRAQQTLGELLDIFDTLFAETQRSPQPSRPDEKEGLQGPAIEDRASQLRKFVEQVQAGKWKGAEARRAATMVLAYVDHGTGVEPRPQDRQEAVSFSFEPSASGGAVQRAAGGGRDQ